MDDLRADLGLDGFFSRSQDLLLVIEASSGRLRLANPAALEILEYPEDQILCLRFQDLFVPEFRSEALALLTAFASPSSHLPSAHARLQRADQSGFPCEWFAWPREVGGGSFVVALFRDLSEQQRAIEEIRLRNVAMASVSSGVTIADARLPDLPLIYVNRGFEEITGYKAREAVGRSCRFLQGTDRNQPDLVVLREALREGRACVVRLRNYRKNGERFWNELHISPVNDEKGELTHYVGIQLDVTDRVESRLRLEESEERYRALAESIDDLVARTSREGIVQFLSPSFRRHAGREPGDWLGRDFGELLHPEDQKRYRETLAGLTTTTPSRQHSFRLCARRQHEVWMEATSTLVSEHDREAYIVSVARDVTLRRKAEEDIRVALERERELNLIKSGFIRMVSHEFRTPMTGIGASTAFLAQYGESLTLEKRTRHFENIERSLARMNQLLDDVLFVSRSESGRIPFKAESVKVRHHCEELVEEVLVAHPGRHVEFTARLPDGIRFELDPNLLHHIIQNLLGNALKYSPKDTSVHMEVGLSDDGEELHWTIRDEGIGIPEADREHLFEPFQRAGNVSTVRGTGLGLYIAKRSAELHGGSISFTSTEGKGSQFSLHLPAQHSPAEDA
jgi:PAS domain S-box-containing protein